MKKILLLGSQHGNELLGDKLYDYISSHHKDLLAHIEFMIANPKAHTAKKRYIESDMNRSYVDTPVTYEQHRAKEIIDYIQKNKFDIVLDLHTSGCIQPPSFIIKDKTPANANFIDASSIEYVALMHHDIVNDSLLGRHAAAVSIEVSTKDLKPKLYEDLAQDIRRYINHETTTVTKSYYEIVDLLYKNKVSASEVKSLKNFEKSVEGYYPILFGENSYKKQTNYLGFKSYLIQNEKYKEGK